MDEPVTHKQAERVAFVQLGRNTAYEFVLTSILLFGVASIVRWVIGPSVISRSIPQIHTELVIVGAAVALLLAVLILSPLGRASGGHMNPAISLAMWRFGVFPGVGIVPYTIAQLLGSVVGVVGARLLWGHVIAERPVAYAALQPGPLWSFAELFAAETVSMAVIVLIVGICLAEDRVARFVPWVVGVLIGMAIAVLGTSTGGSVNPARQLGPAVMSGETHFLSVYLLAPMLGAVIGAWLRQTIQHRRAVLTHRLCGTQADGRRLSDVLSAPYKGRSETLRGRRELGGNGVEHAYTMVHGAPPTKFPEYSVPAPAATTVASATSAPEHVVPPFATHR